MERKRKMDGKEAILNYGNVSVGLGEEGEAVFRLRGEMDHHNVKKMREIMDEKLIDYRPSKVIIDLNEVTFTDSAGLGLILGRYTRISGYGGTLMLVGVSEEFMKILRLAGTDKLMRIEKRSTKKKIKV